jgi:hypothetical protein
MKEINAAYAQLKRQRTLHSTVFGGNPAKSKQRENTPRGTYAGPHDTGIL